MTIIVKKGGKGSGPQGGHLGGHIDPTTGKLARGGSRKAGDVAPIVVTKPQTWYQVMYPKVSRIFGDKLHVDGDGPIQQQHLKDLSKIPDAMLQDLTTYGTEIYIGNTSVTGLDNMQSYAGVTPRGWPKGYTWDNVAGCYSSSDNCLLLGIGEGGSNSIVFHEVGHAIDYTADEHRMGFGYSQREKFRDTYR
jgi:hypothetical protein